MKNKRIVISVIIVNYNGVQHLDECLTSLSNQSFHHFEIIFVDNGSTDGSVGYVENYFPDIRTVALGKNEGFCRGNNVGLRYASGDFIALLNNDTLADTRWLEEMYNAMKKDSTIGICSSCMVNYYSREVLDTAGDGYDICGVGFKVGEGMPVSDFQTQRYVFGSCAGAALYRRSMLGEIGFLDDRFFAYGEDLDLSFRAKLAGYKCLYVPKAVVYHKINQTFGRESDFLLYHTRRNVEYTYFKNMPFLLLLLTLPLHLIYNTLTFIQALFKGRTKIFLKAKFDFLKNFNEILSKRNKIQKKRKISNKQLLSVFSINYLYNSIKSIGLIDRKNNHRT